jgi:hypothetical protein
MIEEVTRKQVKEPELEPEIEPVRESAQLTEPALEETTESEPELQPPQYETISTERLKDYIFFNNLFQMCEEHIPDVVPQLLDHGKLGFPPLEEIDFSRETTIAEWQPY